MEAMPRQLHEGPPAAHEGAPAPGSSAVEAGAAASGERLTVPERVILAPMAGRFQPLPDDVGGDVTEAQVIGFIEGHGQSTPVQSPFGGLLMGLLAHAGERVREGQPVAWLRVA